mgnify:CR=1 FL=1
MTMLQPAPPVTTAPAPKQKKAPLPLWPNGWFGINLGYPDWYNGGIEWEDHAHRRGDWQKALSSGAAVQPPVLAAVDAADNPTESASAQLIGQFNYPGGPYTFTGPSDAKLLGPGVVSGAGSAYVLNGTGGVSAFLPTGGGPVSLTPASPAGDLFTAQFLSMLDSVKPAIIRAGQWQRINECGQDTRQGWLPDWEGRAKLTDSRWAADQGTPFELIIALASQTKAWPWVYIPHLADETYVRGMAALFRDAKLPGLFVEFSNELWNAFLSPGAWAKTNGGKKPGIFAGQQAARAFDWWNAEWKDDRTHFVCMGALVDRGVFLSDMLSQLGGRPTVTGCSGYVPVSVTKYLGLADKGKSLTPAQLLADMQENMIDVLASVRAHVAIGDAIGAKTALYEAAPSAIPSGRPWANAALALDQLPEMQSFARDLLVGLRGAGADYMNWFDLCGDPSTQSGSFGLWYDYLTSTKKLAGVREALGLS